MERPVIAEIGSRRDHIAVAGIRLSKGAVIIICVIWCLFDTRELASAIEGGEPDLSAVDKPGP